MNIPNKLTVARMIMVPFFVLFSLTGWGGAANRYICLVIFVGASITDWLDGHLARKNNLVTNFGKFMDPLADKLLVSSALIAFIELHRIPAWIVIIIIAREFIISGYRLVAADKGIVIAAGIWGKVKTAVTMVMLCIVIADLGRVGVLMPYATEIHIVEMVLIYISLILTVVSLIDYLLQNKDVLSDVK